jgi:hypothetical protein
VINDLHIGSNYAMLPPNITVESGGEERPLVPFPRQLKLWRLWQSEILPAIQQFNPESVFLLGENIHGINPSEYGLDRNPLDIKEQMKIARKILFPVCANRTVWTFRASKYHSSFDTELEQWIAGDATTGGVAKRYEDGGSFALVGMGGKYSILMTHQLSGTKPNSWQRQLRDAKAGEAIGTLPRCDAVIAAHIHTEGHFEDVTGIVHVSPSLCMLEPGKPTAKNALTFGAYSMPGVTFIDASGDKLLIYSRRWPVNQIERRESYVDEVM